MLFGEIPRDSARVAEGVAHVPHALDLAAQRELVDAGRELARQARMRRPELLSGTMSVYMAAAGYRWVGDLNTYELAPVEMPEWAIQLGKRGLEQAAALADELQVWVAGFRPEMVLVNYYPPGARMGLHQDAGEESAAPIVSYSVGESALFRLGNTENRNRPWRDIQLLSGDLLVFGGAHRMAYHGVPRLYPGTCPAGCGLAEGRINVTIRQVTL
ncbi:alpha-ketoglutarate-dependent dioxygenase AlkB [Staphylococcus chromogenes]|nr:alpha-ketoglutarate-dependent dioxygenase AlkB [Staphylococcus chromogenes]